ncbi:hypothetical protein VQH23_16140 [Pararoseomonas sp. SCSIO 73927]|uniref:hypothetical protein n=1 Tax=Pararoseomonas sp. SCSIO 73927 TaxID=3114537 RepID=UPI0030D4F20F
MRPFLPWATSAALLLGVPPAAAAIFVAVQSELRMPAAMGALVEVSAQPLTLCPDVARPIRRTTGGRT